MGRERSEERVDFVSFVDSADDSPGVWVLPMCGD